MKAAIELIAQYERWIYSGLGLVSILYIWRLIRARLRLSATPFGLERESAYHLQNGSLAMLFILGALAGSVYIGTQYILPNIDLLTAGPPPTPAPATATPIGSSVIVDSSGCANPNVTLIKPESNERIAGAFETKGTANIPDFAFYKLELSGANTQGEWATVDVGSKVIISDTLGTFDSSLYLPGEYAFRLVVFDAAGNSPPPCVVAPFVASFVGTLNQLRCTVVDAAKGQVRYDGQVIDTGERIAEGNGASVTLMLRPEELRLGDAGGENRLVGTIEQVSFQGATIRVTVNLGKTSLTLDVFNERTLQLPKIGQQYTLSFPPHACWVMVTN